MRYLSLFSGIEAATAAWHPLGFDPVAFAEIEPFPCAVLAHHYPGVPNLGSVTDITDYQIKALGNIDVVVGGSPCQDLSIAGKRHGLAGERSGLFHEQIRIFNAARLFCGARWLVWENVTGAFSSNKGRDFAVVAGAMAGCDLDVPEDGWGTEGMALGENGLVEWCVLDAQWFGVAQRRRRVFAVLDAGNWSDRPPVLLERDSLRGNYPPSREQGKEVAPCLSARSKGGGGLGTDFDLDGGLIQTFDRLSYSEYGDSQLASTISARDYKSQIDLVAYHDKYRNGAAFGTSAPAIAFPARLSGTQFASAENLSPSLCAMNPTAVAIPAQPSAVRDVAQTITSDYGRNGVAFGVNESPDLAHCLRASASRADKHDSTTYIAAKAKVRRLTPRECERLQGFSDDYTAIEWRLKPVDKCPDGPRYKALGNSMSVPVMNWIGRRIKAVELNCDE